MDYAKLATDLEEYCKKKGLAPSTVCVRALGDSRYLDRLRRRLEVLERDDSKIRDFMREHPAPDAAEDAA